jgi:CheY-like chemotaxis protein
VALGGQQALAIYRSDRFDLVISDLVMPAVPGDVVLAKILARDPHAQVVIMTGQLGGEQGELLVAGGALAVLSKPFTREELRAVLAAKAPALERAIALTGPV